MITKNVKLYLTGGFPVRIPVSQFDTMWQFVFSIVKDGLEWTIPSGASAVLNGLKPDGNVFAFSGTISGNTVTVDADVQMTAVAGDTICELSILATEGSEVSQRAKVVGTANFVLAVEAAPKSPDDVSSESTLPVYEEMLDQLAHTATILLPNRIKEALLACFQNVAWVTADGQDYYDQLELALYDAEVISLTAVFEQGQHTVYDSDSLDTLKQYLTVTALYDDGNTYPVTSYTLSGTLTAGTTSTITVTYREKTTTFNVTVTAWDYSWDYTMGKLEEQTGWKTDKSSSGISTSITSNGEQISATADGKYYQFVIDGNGSLSALRTMSNGYGVFEVVVNGTWKPAFAGAGQFQISSAKSSSARIQVVADNDKWLLRTASNAVDCTPIANLISNTDYRIRIVMRDTVGDVYINGVCVASDVNTSSIVGGTSNNILCNAKVSYPITIKSLSLKVGSV